MVLWMLPLLPMAILCRLVSAWRLFCWKNSGVCTCRMRWNQLISSIAASATTALMPSSAKTMKSNFERCQRSMAAKASRPAVMAKQRNCIHSTMPSSTSRRCSCAASFGPDHATASRRMKRLMAMPATMTG
ncbi:hypothetical protein D9M68_959390 [compost metagenome]